MTSISKSFFDFNLFNFQSLEVSVILFEQESDGQIYSLNSNSNYARTCAKYDTLFLNKQEIPSYFKRCFGCLKSLQVSLLRETDNDFFMSADLKFIPAN
jgi:hypothetical protein